LPGGRPLDPPEPEPAAAAAPAAASPFRTIIDIPRQTLIFKPSRQDMTVGQAVFPLYCSRPDAVRVNGVRPEPAWMNVRLTETGEIIVIERTTAATDAVFLHIDLREVAANEFELGPLKIELSDEPADALLCMSVKVWFHQVTNQYDGLFYRNVDDRYTLVSFCTRPPDASPVKSRFRQNRVETVAAFQDVLAKPMAIELNDRALRAEWSPRK
jgi:hypothetical protein